jgi:hypothetical protein
VQVQPQDTQTGWAIRILFELRKAPTDSVRSLFFYPSFVQFIVLLDALAKILVYSMAVDGPVRQDAALAPRRKEGRFEAQQTGFLEGSKALDSLDRLITSTESFFHPSNSGQWTVQVSDMVSITKVQSHADLLAH